MPDRPLSTPVWLKVGRTDGVAGSAERVMTSSLEVEQASKHAHHQEQEKVLRA